MDTTGDMSDRCNMTLSNVTLHGAALYRDNTTDLINCMNKTEFLKTVMGPKTQDDEVI